MVLPGLNKLAAGDVLLCDWGRCCAALQYRCPVRAKLPSLCTQLAHCAHGRCHPEVVPAEHGQIRGSLAQERWASVPVSACMHLALLLPPQLLHVMSFHCRYCKEPLPAGIAAYTATRHCLKDFDPDQCLLLHLSGNSEHFMAQCTSGPVSQQHILQ